MRWKDLLLDVVVGHQVYGAARRIAAGVLAALFAPTLVAVLFVPWRPHWLFLVLGACATYVLAYLAVTGRLPRGLRPGRSETIER
jgi:hypothetical protein